MTNQEKQQILDAFKLKLEKIPKRNKQDKGLGVATKQMSLSTATLSQLYNGNWNHISDEAWRTVANWSQYETKEWVTVETKNYRTITDCLTDAQDDNECYGIIGKPGFGKTKTIDNFIGNNNNAYLLCCNEFWNRKIFLQELLRGMAIDHSGINVSGMMELAIRNLKRQDNPIIVMDELEKVPDVVMLLFITLFNQLEEKCGLVVVGTGYLADRLQRGIDLNKKGYREIWSRLGKKWIMLDDTSRHDIAQICLANGIEDHDTIEAVIKESEGDLRRVKRSIKKEKKRALRKATV